MNPRRARGRGAVAQHRLTFVRIDLQHAANADVASMTLTALSHRSAEPFSGLPDATAHLRAVSEFLTDHQDTLAGPGEQTLTVAGGTRGIVLRIVPERDELILEWREPNVAWEYASYLTVSKPPSRGALATAVRILAEDVVSVETESSTVTRPAHRATRTTGIEVLPPWWINWIQVGTTGLTHTPHAHRRYSR